MDSQETPQALDETAQRILNLLFILNSATRPLTTTEIISDSDLGYGSDNVDSDKKKFRRDREKLREQGIFVNEIKPSGASENEESRWALNRDDTFAARSLVSPQDIDILLQAIDAELQRPEGALSQPLLAIRAKIARCANRTIDAPANVHTASPVEEAVWTAFSLRRKLTVLYTNAAGEERKRTIAIYGMFTREGIAYVTGLDDATNEVRTFRIDRIRKAWRPKGSYTIPATFNIRDFMFLEFDFGAHESTDVTFVFPDTLAQTEIQSITYNRGQLSRADDGTHHWTIAAKDIYAAVRFGLAHASRGMRPLAPQALVDAWNDTLLQVVSAHECN